MECREALMSSSTSTDLESFKELGGTLDSRRRSIILCLIQNSASFLWIDHSSQWWRMNMLHG